MALIAPCTTVDRGLPHHVAPDWQATGLDSPTWVRTEDIRSISERRLIRRGPLGHLTAPDLTKVRCFIRLMTDD
jgi:mRNA-degrading endonuclease toxin of MazEF toxin-antitoxin module